ncbi:NirD/YgiW/YdeI family stress tolerance protein [Parendozoicomonas haliclonae]|uniref:Bacterial OB fold (BOF) protein n=1 Tax=Parendozoicomonas haliclonae TaxID=1960125 RepID=A0A1X7AJI7_9GAMM|nr:NirD/YgiW/YdeI family stress tolerance protein [Parendozoicomonas haliclonae]SMA45600.1 Bacterial OB fold (BOF) protein [Parendozoicomonas haliclonae]
MARFPVRSKNFLTALISAAALSLFPQYGATQPAGQHTQQEQVRYPENDEPTRLTIREALRAERHNYMIELSGVVLRQTGPHSAIIHDGTAAIEVELPPAQVPSHGLKANSHVRVRGEINHEGHRAHEVEVTEAFWSF